MHIAIFPTWSCQLSCSYCSIRNSQIDRGVEGVEWRLWANTLPRLLAPGTTIDIAGGEPLLYPGIVQLLRIFGDCGYPWGLTTNAKDSNVVAEICQAKLKGCICINVSDHEGNPVAGESAFNFRKAGYRVNVHRVAHIDAGWYQHDAQMITYQDWVGGKAVDGKRRHCTAGINHWIAGPNGDMWRCIVAAQMGQPISGNLFDGQRLPTSMICDFGCSSCYTEDPASWGIEMREI